MHLFTDLEVAKIEVQAAVSAGVGYAQMLNVGDRFLGALPAARCAFPHDRAQQELFMTAALANLPGVIVTDEANIITELQR